MKTKKKPLVSVAMPVYNEEQFIGKALDSLLQQNFEDFELIILDNVSTDRTYEICSEYKKKDWRIKLYRNEKNLGAGSFKKLLNLSSGKYFMFAGGHDLWEPSLIGRCAKVLNGNSDVVLCHSKCAEIDREDKITRIMPDSLDTQGLSIEDSLPMVWLLKTGVPIYGMIHLDVLNRVNYDRKILGGDVVILGELCTLGSIAYINELLSYQRNPRFPESPEQSVRRTLIAINNEGDHHKISFETAWLDLFRGHMDVLNMLNICGERKNFLLKKLVECFKLNYGRLPREEVEKLADHYINYFGNNNKKQNPPRFINEAKVALEYLIIGLLLYPENYDLKKAHGICSNINANVFTKRVRIAGDDGSTSNLTMITTESEFSNSIRQLFESIGPKKIIETGTYLGTGTTTTIVSSLKRLGIHDAIFYSIEVNPEHYNRALVNLMQNNLNPNVKLLNGLSIPRQLLPTIEEIRDSCVNNIEFDGIYVDHQENERALLYYQETNFENLKDDLLGECLKKFDYSPDFVLLDSGGHMGNIEFNYLVSMLRSECYIALDDIYHIKHHKDFLQIQNDSRFELLTSSKEKFGFCIAKFTPEQKNIENSTENILWIRTDSIGDNFLAASMLPHIRKKYEKAKITVVCQKHISELYEACPFVDDIIAFDKQRAYEDEEYRLSIISQLQATNFGIALNSVYSREPLSDVFAIGSRAKAKIAFNGDLCNIPTDMRDMNNRYYSRLLVSEEEHKSELERHRDFLNGLGIGKDLLQPIVWITPEDERFANEFFKENNLKPEASIALFAGVQYNVRFYDKYGEALLGASKGKEGEFTIIAFGTDREHAINQQNLDVLDIPTINLCGKTTLRQTAALLKLCRLAFGAETGTAHMACAIGTPNVVLLGGGHFGRFMPYSPLTTVVCLPLECYGCDWHCRYGRVHCVRDIRPEVIAAAIRKTLGKTSAKSRVVVQANSLWNRSVGGPQWKSIEQFLDPKNIEVIFIGEDGRVSEADAFYREKKTGDRGQWTEIRNQESEIGGQRSEVRGPKSEDRDQRANLQGARAVESPERLYQEAQELINCNRKKDAVNALEKLVASCPDHALAHNDLGVLYFNEGDKEKTLQHYQKAASLESHNSVFQKNLADFYFVEMGQVEEAMQIYVKVLNSNPEDIETLLVLAHICISLEKFGDAKDFYNRILKIEPGNKDAREFLDKLGKCQLSAAGGQTDQSNKDADSNGYLVSAIVSTYNAERFIRGCLEDLENQTIADKIEIIVVDSGSQQGEEAVIREFQEKYSNIKYIKTDQRETVYAAWNRGIQVASGKYIANANADDRHREDALEVMVNILETLPDISLVYADIIITETENEKFESCTPVGYFNWMNFSREDLLNKGCFVGPQPMWRRDVHNEYGYFDDSFLTSGDYEFWLRISQSCIFMHLPVQLGLYLRSPGSIEHSNREKQREENNKIFKMYKYAQSSGKIIRRLKTCLSQDHTEQSSQNKKSPEKSYQNIRAALGNKRPEEIIEELERLSVSFPEFALVHNDLGGLCYNNGDQENALNHYQKAVQLEPANATFQKNLADYYFVELDRKEEALQIYLRLLNHHPNDLELNLTAAHICVAVQNFSDAKVLYKRVLDIDPENEDARNNLRTLDKIKGDLRTGQPSKTESPQKSSPEEYSLATETTRVNDASEKDIPQFSIIMPTSAPLKQFRRCVESIKEHISESYEILFVNNGTTKGVLKWVRQCIDENHNWHLVKCGKGANPAVCYNTGIKAARGEYIVLLSNDVVVTDGWLSSMLQCFSSIPDAGMVGTMTNRARGRQKVAAAVNTSFKEINAFAESYRATNRNRRIVCDVPDGFCLLFQRDLTEKIGLFDEQMGALGFEDEDYCLRAALEGYVNQIAGDVYLHRLERKAPARSKKHFNLKWSGADIQSPTGKRHLALRAVEKANSAAEEGKSDLAVELFLQAIGLLPEHKESYCKLAEMLVNTKRFKDALDVLNELPEGDPDARHLELAACCQEGLERFEEAERYADQALEINRCAPSALNTKGIIAFRRDDKNAAESYFTRAMETDPGFGEAYTNLGALKWAAGFKDEALSLYECGFILSPTVPDIALNYHSALADLGEYQRAESVVREAAAVHPRNKKIRYMLIDILLHLQNLEMAMQEIETAIADFGVDDGILSSALNIRDKIGPLTIDRKTDSGSTVSLCMIAKDEEEHLARCLQSVRPVVDEIIVVDTGSSDRSRDIARVFGAKVFDFEWAEDFASARNYSLSKATGKMVFVMDADEVISPLDYELFRQTARQSSRQRSAFIINTRNYTMDNNLVEWVANEGYYDIEEAGTGWTPSAKIRLFPNDPHIRFDFPVHEMVEPSLRKMGIAMKLCKFQVHHYGKLNRYKSEKKGEAYYEIGCKKLEEMGDAPVALRELAIQAEGLKKHEEAVKLWERFIAIVPNEPKAYINMGISYCGLGQFDKVLTTAEKALKFAPDSKEGHFNRALAKLHLGHPDQAIEILEKLCEEMPEYLPARFILAAACCCGKDKKRGMVLLKELSRTDIGPGLAIRCHELASRFVLLQRPAYALALLDAAIDSQNGNKDVLDLYADCLKMTNSHKKTGTYE